MAGITAYEAERNARIEANRQRMLALNLPEVSCRLHQYGSLVLDTSSATLCWSSVSQATTRFPDEYV